MNYKIDLMGKSLAGDKRHPQELLRDLGITYVRAIPQSMGECWILLGCRNIPKSLPRYVDPISTTARDYIGYGLTKEEAEDIESSLRDALEPKITPEQYQELRDKIEGAIYAESPCEESIGIWKLQEYYESIYGEKGE